MLIGFVMGMFHPGVGSLDDFVLDAFVLTLVVQGHVAEGPEAELSDLGVVVFMEDLHNILVVEHQDELLDSALTKKWFDTTVAESNVAEGLEQVDEVLGIFRLELLFRRVQDERGDHIFGAGVLNHSLNAVIVAGKSHEAQSGGLTDL